MTSHIPGYDHTPRRRNGLATIREDIHLHAAIARVRAAVSDPTAFGAWLPENMSNYHADTEGLRVDLALPGRTETFSLRRAPTEDQREVLYRQDGEHQGGTIDELSWGLHSEGATECHITIEIAYRPASGFLGGAMETLAHRPQRTQAIRDLLWNLKRDIEGPRDDPES